MDVEIKRIELQYKELLEQLKIQAETNSNTIMNSNSSNEYKFYYFNQIKIWFFQMLQNLQNQRDNQIKAIKHKYFIYKNPRPPTKAACLIGINYVNTNSELRGCINDVIKLKSILQTKFEYHPDHILTLTNDQATRNNIINTFTRLLINSEEGDTLFFSFAGHGAYSTDNNSDETDGKDEFIVSVDNQPIIDDEFKLIIDKYLKPGVKLVTVFDNCHSGTILDLPYQYINKDTFKSHHSTTTKGEVICISGCKDNQVSADAYIKGTFNGAMTWALVEVLSTCDKNSTWDQCLTSLREKLRIGGFPQLPQLTSGTKLDFNEKYVNI